MPFEHKDNDNDSVTHDSDYNVTISLLQRKRAIRIVDKQFQMICYIIVQI